MGRSSAEVKSRRATTDDLPAVIDLAAKTLGWEPDRPNAAFFRWKHVDNPFGASPIWLAEAEGRLVGVRAFLRWQFRRPDGTPVDAVRAVDTATHPDFQGRGIFATLTMEAVDELRDDGVGFVFNTPNDKSRPGYLKMGWVQLGRVPIATRVTSPMAGVRMLKAKVAADKWSQPTAAGEPAADLLAGAAGDIEALATTVPASGHWTMRTPAYLTWRYSFGPLCYRAIASGGVARDGLCVFRVRQRGRATEATICEMLVPGGDPATVRSLARAVARVSGADYLLWAGRSLPPTAGFVPLPQQGPILTWRALADTRQPALTDWQLTMGDVELF